FGVFSTEVHGGSINVKPPAEKLVDILWSKQWAVEVKMYIQNKLMVLRKWEPNLQKLDFSHH
ncbi:hypothetical protein Gogos_009960, partial [Gossypium gossypioides]|nr:hypothetical protein [Gossypium gossypioides]